MHSLQLIRGWRSIPALALAWSAACQGAEPVIGQADEPVVYGTDDRMDVYAHPDPVWAGRAADTTVALMPADALDIQPNGSVLIAAPTLAEAFGVCPGERFVDQPTPAACSGTLIGPDLVLTAGSCVPDQAACDAVRVVFDFYMADASNLAAIDEADDVYTCAGIVARHKDNSLDYAFVRLDRPVVGHTPAAVDRAADLTDGAPLVTAGCPSGLPVKLDSGGRVRDSRSPVRDYFVAELDTFVGSAGAGVFDPATGDLVGVFARGEADYVADGACTRPRQCPTGTCVGEDVTYAARALEGLCGDGVCDGALGEASTTCPDDCGGAVCSDGACNGGETPTSCPADCGTCGNDTCDPGETITSCPDDCESACGDATCSAAVGEDTATCYEDCGTSCGDGACNGDEGTQTNPCAADCACGDGTCDAAAGEDTGTCCTDCGCPDDNLERCTVNQCVARGEVCVLPAIIAISDEEQVIVGDTYGGNSLYAGSCVAGDSPERIYTFTLSGETLVQAEVSGYDTALYLRHTCNDNDAANEIACNDEGAPPGDNGSRIEAQLPAGDYFLMVDGYDGDSGAFTLTVRFTLLCGDMDGDLECDQSDGCPEDPNKVGGGQCGCGTPDTDSDGDGTADCNDQCPIDGLKVTEGDCGCGTPEGECKGCGCDLARAHTPTPYGSGLALLSCLAALAWIRRPRRRRAMAGARRRIARLAPLLALPLAFAACGPNDHLDRADCAEITCAANAHCVQASAAAPPLCECDDGYDGDRRSCSDIDECAQDLDDCGTDALCVNTAGAYSCEHPSTCEDVRALMPDATDGEYTLYIDAMAAKPWHAVCLDMDEDLAYDPNTGLPLEGDASPPREYLPLLATGADQNFAEYLATADGKYGKSVRTIYTHVRLDPATLTIDATDAALAWSTGTTVVDGSAVSAVPFGVAMSCDRASTARANIDLTGLPFTMTSGLCQGGFGVTGAPTGVPADTAVDLSAVGTCGWTRPDDACAASPLAGGAVAVSLSYTPYQKRVFVTSDAYPSDLGGVPGADATCQSLADGAGLGGVYKAWLGSSAGHPDERFTRHQAPYTLVDGTVVAQHWNDLTDGSLLHPIDLDQNGQPPVPGATVMCTDLGATAVWTGTSASGTDLLDGAFTCTDWTGTGASLGAGSFDRKGSGWSDACRLETAEPGADICQGQLAHLYCFEQ